MLLPPTPPSPGKPVSAGFFARLIAWVRSSVLIEGPGYRLRRGPNGTSLILPPPKAATPPTVMHYWQFDAKPVIDGNGEPTGEFEGGWYNCKAQIGLGVTPLMGYKPGQVEIDGCDLTEEGKYYAKFEIAADGGPKGFNGLGKYGGCSIVTESTMNEENDEEPAYLRNVVYFYIGKIENDENGKPGLTDDGGDPGKGNSIDIIPCIYTYTH